MTEYNGHKKVQCSCTGCAVISLNEMAASNDGMEKSKNIQIDSFRLAGLDCTDCAAKLEKYIAQLSGVRSVKLNFGASKMLVEHTAGTGKIIKRVEEAGYSATLDVPGQSARKTVFRLSGLDCADCAAKLEQKISGMGGVESVIINFGAAKITVCHTIGVAEITRAVKESGYIAELESAAVDGNNRGTPWRDRKLMLNVLSGLFVLSGFTASMISAPSSVVLVLYLAAMLSGGLFVAKNAYYSLKSLSLDMNVLMTIAVVGASAIGQWAEGAMVVFLFALGNTLQAYSMDKTRNSIRALMELSPKEALVRRGGQEMKLPVEEIMVGDIVIIKPGERIAVDGRVTAGVSTVNQAPITGESMPVGKAPGIEVFAGTINEKGSLEVEVTKVARDTMLARVIDMVEEAQGQKAPSQQFVDVFAKYYTPAVVVAAVAIAVFPSFFLGMQFKPWLERALILLVIACPCALVISTPVSIISAIGSAARRGVLIKGGAYLEAAGALKVLAFDKTGTLTEGSPEVTNIIALAGYTKKDVLITAAAVENRSQHPLARAVIRHAGQMGVNLPESSGFQSITGKGASSVINGKRYYTGSLRLFNDLNLDTAAAKESLLKLQKEGKTAVIVGSHQGIMGIIAIADKVRSNSARALEDLRSAGIQKIVMLTGDNKIIAGNIASGLKLDAFHADLLPGDKLEVIKKLQSQFGSVGMVGDGVNDAPALAAANIGIAMGGAGTDTALEIADIALMADDLAKLPYTIKLSRWALRIIKQNIAFALLVKVAFIAGTFWGFTNLWMAVFADTGAALLVIANGMRLMRLNDRPCN
ncbi:heavy metal translocating P-type ATPase [Desulfotruncus alcoholivorax]|uniref:heavy metal translocating P-type ATPase n=1 Tax=Desulfotruncus alcoholivorax TaxID=265477 RepID=UPI000428D0F6|nr:heavy metal translocating P-type ATPase [Desulfotruncus alcoholivorax]